MNYAAEPGQPLSKRERELVIQIMRGKSDKEIALELGISIHTVRNSLSTIFVKAGVCSRLQLGLKYQFISLNSKANVVYRI
jgi:DNA-binding CsgD family transcriptional regulator